MAPALPSLIYQFKVTLNDIEPAIWRRILVPERYSFWDLHVAIQDSMGWLDYHLHSFILKVPGSKKKVEVGIPGDEFDHPVVPGWKTAINSYFVRPGATASYEYDFGDSWGHEIVLEGMFLSEKAARYPKCIAGERACPPEDCGGIPGYSKLLRVLGSPADMEHEEIASWLKGHAKSYWPYDPDHFEPSSVRFSDPRKRWQRAFATPQS
jgi:Plasmid pRiA4b ORF-3-like protein